MWIKGLKEITCRRRSLNAWSDLSVSSLYVLRIDLFWFDSSKRPLKVRIWSGRLREVRLYLSMRAVTSSN